MFEREWQGKHDEFIRWCFGHVDVLTEFCRWFLPEDVLAQVDFSGIQVEEGSFIDDELKKSFSDILATVPLKGDGDSVPQVARIYLLIEHKTASEPLTVFQVLKYMVRIWEREERNAKEKAAFRFSPIFPVILHHGRTKFTAPLDFQELIASVAGMEDFVPKFRPKLIDLNAISEDDLPRDDPRLFSALAAMQTVFGKELSPAFQESLRRLGAVFDEPGAQEFINVVLKYITTNTREMDQEKNRTILREIKNRTGEPIMATIAEKWIEDLRVEVTAKVREEVREEVKEQVKQEVKEQVKQEVKEQVKQEVKEQVKQEVKEQVKEEVAAELKEEVTEKVKEEVKREMEGEWLARGKASTIIRFLLGRFSTVPDDVQDTIREIADPDRLDELAARAAVCQNLDEFRGALRQE